MSCTAELAWSPVNDTSNCAVETVEFGEIDAAHANAVAAEATSGTGASNARVTANDDNTVAAPQRRVARCSELLLTVNPPSLTTVDNYEL